MYFAILVLTSYYEVILLHVLYTAFVHVFIVRTFVMKITSLTGLELPPPGISPALSHLHSPVLLQRVTAVWDAIGLDPGSIITIVPNPALVLSLQ